MLDRDLLDGLWNEACGRPPTKGLPTPDSNAGRFISAILAFFESLASGDLISRKALLKKLPPIPHAFTPETWHYEADEIIKIIERLPRAAAPEPPMDGHKWDEGWNRMTQTNRCEVSGLLNRECYGCLRGEIDRLNDSLQYALYTKTKF